MAFPEGGSPAAGGRCSSTERPRSLSNESESDESYDLTEFAVADGFRPSDAAPSLAAPAANPQGHFKPNQQPLLQRRSISSSSAANAPSSPQPEQPTTSNPTGDINVLLDPNPGPSIPRPSSVSKPHRPHDSLSLQNDGSNLASTTQTSLSHPTALSSNSSSERNDGGLQPTPASTLANPDRGPAHPYSLYPQNTMTVDDTGDEHIPVGFPGIATTYQRQIGPDGEEAGGLIGPLGHTEELPPYTRYPDPVYTRSGPSATTPSAASASTSVVTPPSTGTAAAAVPPATANSITIEPDGSQSPIDSSSPTRTTHNSEPAEMTSAGAVVRHVDEASLEGQSGRSLRSDNISDNSRNGLNSATRVITEKLPMGKWQRRARKRLWGVIPYWAICLVLTGVVILAIIMGAVIGTVLTGKNKSDRSSQTDVEPLASIPPDLAPLATGLFDLPPLDVTQSPRICFQDTTQAQAWSCEMPNRYYSMHVGQNHNSTSAVENFEFTMRAVNGTKSFFVWGTQPPSIEVPLTLKLVNDSFEPSRGPAWWSKFEYNKIVIIPESAMQAQQTRDEWTYTGNPSVDTTKFQAKPSGPQNGERPWICTWPDIKMEIFIYPNQNASNPSPSSPTTTSRSSSSATDTSSDASPTLDDPTPAYPQVVKLLERRIIDSDDEETAATCRQYEIINKGKDKREIFDKDGLPVVVFISERQSTWQEQLAARERSRHPSRRDIGNLSFQRRETLELTDCGCLWWST